MKNFIILCTCLCAYPAQSYAKLTYFGVEPDLASARCSATATGALSSYGWANRTLETVYGMWDVAGKVSTRHAVAGAGPTLNYSRNITNAGSFTTVTYDGAPVTWEPRGGAGSPDLGFAAETWLDANPGLYSSRIAFGKVPPNERFPNTGNDTTPAAGGARVDTATQVIYPRNLNVYIDVHRISSTRKIKYVGTTTATYLNDANGRTITPTLTCEVDYILPPVIMSIDFPSTVALGDVRANTQVCKTVKGRVTTAGGEWRPYTLALTAPGGTPGSGTWATGMGQVSITDAQDRPLDGTYTNTTAQKELDMKVCVRANDKPGAGTLPVRVVASYQ